MYLETHTQERAVCQRLSTSAYSAYSPMKLMTWLPCHSFGSNLFFLFTTFGLRIFRLELNACLRPFGVAVAYRYQNCPFPFEFVVGFCEVFYIFCAFSYCVICSSINL